MLTVAVLKLIHGVHSPYGLHETSGWKIKQFSKSKYFQSILISFFSLLIVLFQFFLVLVPLNGWFFERQHSLIMTEKSYYLFSNGMEGNPELAQRKWGKG
jgi:hypothetical protein